MCTKQHYPKSLNTRKKANNRLESWIVPWCGGSRASPLVDVYATEEDGTISWNGSPTRVELFSCGAVDGLSAALAETGPHGWPAPRSAFSTLIHTDKPNADQEQMAVVTWLCRSHAKVMLRFGHSPPLAWAQIQCKVWMDNIGFQKYEILSVLFLSYLKNETISIWSPCTAMSASCTLLVWKCSVAPLSIECDSHSWALSILMTSARKSSRKKEITLKTNQWNNSGAQQHGFIM